MKHSVLETSFFLLLIFAGVTLLFLIFKPYLMALFLGLIFAILFNPIYQKILHFVKDKKTVGASLTVLFILIVILIPLFVLGAVLFQEARDATVQLQQSEGVAPYLEGQISRIEDYINDLAPDANFDINIREFIGNGVSWIAENMGGLFSGIARGVINLFLMIASLFFFLRDGEKIRQTVVKWSPLGDKYDKKILDKMTNAVNSVIKGSLLIALIQGFLAGVGFALFGVPSPVLWGFVATIAALIPSAGTAIVVLPAVLYLYFSGAPLWAVIGLIAWGSGVVGLVDNFLRPIFIEKGVKIHPFLILLSVFGGISFFGPIGFLAGPITLSFVFALIEVCPKVLRT